MKELTGRVSYSCKYKIYNNPFYIYSIYLTSLLVATYVVNRETFSIRLFGNFLEALYKYFIYYLKVADYSTKSDFLRTFFF